MPDTGSAVSVGDVVVNFMADMQQLDRGVDSLGPRIESGMAGASAATGRFGNALDDAGSKASDVADEVEEAGNRSAHSLREAKGEAGLLGEAFGIHLPRHVRTFVAELPGVGEALESAFAATAVLFVIEAVVKLTEKVTDFVSTTFVFTEAMKNADAAIVSLNAQIKTQEDRLTAATKAFDRVGLSADKLAHLKIGDDLKTQLDAINKALTESNKKLEEHEAWWKRAGFAVTDWLGVTTHAEDEAAKKHQEMLNNQTQADKASSEAKKVAAQEAATVEKKELLDWEKAQKKTTEELAKITFGFYEKKLEAAGKAAEAEKKLDDKVVKNWLEDTAKMSKALKDSGLDSIVATMNQALSPLTRAIIQQGDAAHKLGITLRSDLVGAYTAAQAAQKQLVASGIALPKELKEAADAVKHAKGELTQFDATGKQTMGTLLEMGLQLKKGKDDWQAFSTEMGSSVADALIAGQGLAKAAEQAVESELAALSRKAMAQAIYYTGLGFAALAGFEDTSATLYFEAAGVLGAIGVGAGVAAHAMTGGSGMSSAGGGSSYQGTGTTGITTTGSGAAPGPQTTTTRLFAGGLVSAPTMAVIGDTAMGGDANEAVLPLDHPDSMAKIAAAIVPHLAPLMGGGGHTFHVNVKGMISDDNLSKVMTKMSKKVNKGTGSLLSSNTHRVTKRSA